MTARVLVTGASRGFGAALAATFAQRGARVFAGTRESRGGLDRAHARFPERIARLLLDVTSDESVGLALAAVSRETDAIDVLVNNAAIRSSTVDHAIETIDFRDVARTFEVNSIGPLRVVQAFLPLLRRGERPVLVNVSSEAGSIGQCPRDREFDYCMSKAALNMASAILANYLKGGVRVLSLHPGWLRTDMGGPRAALDPDDAAERAVALIERESHAPRSAGASFFDYDGNTLTW